MYSLKWIANLRLPSNSNNELDKLNIGEVRAAVCSALTLTRAKQFESSALENYVRTIPFKRPKNQLTVNLERNIFYSVIPAILLYINNFNVCGGGGRV